MNSIGRHPASGRMTVESQSGRHHLILGDKRHKVSLISTESEKVALFTVFLCGIYLSLSKLKSLSLSLSFQFQNHSLCRSKSKSTNLFVNLIESLLLNKS